MRERIHRGSRSSRESSVVRQTISSTKLPKVLPHPLARRWMKASTIVAIAMAVLLWPSMARAQGSPWERAASNLEFTFTGPLARSLALVSIVIGGLMFMFGEGGAKRQISGIVFGGGLALFAAQFMTWLF
jgi:type IV secretory pathway VirB2 component (pilin)